MSFWRRPDSDDSQAAVAHGRTWLLTSALFFGGMAATTRVAVHGVPPAQVALIRSIVGLVAMLGWGATRPALFRSSRWGALALRGAFGGAAVLLYFMSLERVNTGLATLLNNTYPLWAAMLAASFLGERVTLRVMIGFTVAFLGLFVVVGQAELQRMLGALPDRRVQFGLAAGLLSGIVGGGATTVIRSLRRTDGALTIFGAFCAGGIVVSLGPSISGWHPIALGQWPLLIAVGLLSIGGQLGFTYALKFVPASGSVVNLLTVVISYGLAAAFLGEPLTLHAVLGGLVVMTGVYLVSVSGAQASPVAIPVTVEASERRD